MDANWFRCSLTIADEAPCERYARVSVTDLTGESARGCARHAVQALNGIIGLRVEWESSRGLNEHERRAIELAEDRSRLAQHPVTSWTRAA
jgi:hypothetical protein